MPTIEIKGITIHYIQEGDGKQNLVCLHGWGQNIEMMQMISSHMKKYFKVTVLDFPGFGESGEPLVAWSVEDYANFLFDFLSVLKIENPILVGHSFGCRVAFHYVMKHPVHKMILTGAAGIRPEHDLKWHLKTKSYKAAKQLLRLPGLNRYENQVKSHFGSTDYQNTSGVMRETFVKVVNDDISEYLDKIKTPTLLVWGELDEAVPLWMGKRMEERMPNAGLAIFEGDDHYAYWHQWERFNRCMDIFLKEEEEANA